MRIPKIFLAVTVVLALAVPAFAAPVGGPSYNLGAVGLSVAAGVGFLQRDVHVIEDDSIVDEAASSRFLVKLNLAPLDILDVYGLGGAADFSLDDANYRGTLATLYGGGIRPMLLPLWFFQSDLNVSADLQYLAYTTSDEIAGEDIEARYQEFQAALIIAYKLQGVVPYGGVKFNPITIHMTGVDNDLAGDTNAGVFIGTDYFVTPNVFFNGELSIFSETSIFLMVGYGYPGQR